MEKLKIAYWKIERLKPYVGNAKHHDDKQVLEIARSIQRFGFVNPVLVDGTGEIIAGHGRVLAAERLMMDTVPVIALADLSEPERRALRLADNRIAENSTWDEAALRAELQSLRELEANIDELGFSETEMAKLLASIPDLLPDEPYRPEPVHQAPAPVASPAKEPEPEEGGQGDEEEEAPPPPRQPRASDDEYSVFEIVMVHENKVKLLDVLNAVKLACKYEKLEDALMHIVREYDAN